MTLLAEGSLNEPQKLAVTESGVMPIPSRVAAAVEVVMRDKELGPMLGNVLAGAYAPMPPLIVDDEAGGGRRRVLAVGLLPSRGTRGHEIVGVDIGRRSVLRFDGGAPDTAQAHNPICGQPYAGQPTASKGTAGHRVRPRQPRKHGAVEVPGRQADSLLGDERLRIELRFVDYRRKRLLYRAHVPILNVKYDGNACVPYLDWQYEEGMIHAPTGSMLTRVFDSVPRRPRRSSIPATDTGNFLGSLSSWMVWR